MQNLETIKELKNAANEIENLFLIKIPKWKANPSHYDKASWGFEQGGHNGWYTPLVLHFGAWCGTYGNSSTYKQFSIDEKIFYKHLIKYLNNNMESIMLGVAGSIKSEAATLVDKASKEIEDQKTLINSLTVS